MEFAKHGRPAATGDGWRNRCWRPGAASGFRFHPSNEEIIIYYLTPKVIDNSFTMVAVGEADFNKYEPWDLPMKAKMGENDWYFYYLKECKYPSGKRVNRATEAGYWKTTGKDKEIYWKTAAGRDLIGMKKTLVFYMGRAPDGTKTDWVMHEFRLEGGSKFTHPKTNSSSTTKIIKKSSSKEEWVVCRLIDKSLGIKKALTPFHMAMASDDIDQTDMNFSIPMQFSMGPDDFFLDSNSLCPLMDPSGSLYSTDDMTSLVPLGLPPIAGIGTVGLEIDGSLFGNLNYTLKPMSFSHEMRMGAPVDNGFVAGSNPTLMAPQDNRMGPNQNNATEISSVVPACPTSVASVDVDGLWKYE